MGQNLKISEFLSAETLRGDEEFVLAKAGENRKVALDKMREYIAGKISLEELQEQINKLQTGKADSSELTAIRDDVSSAQDDAERALQLVRDLGGITVVNVDAHKDIPVNVPFIPVDASGVVAHSRKLDRTDEDGKTASYLVFCTMHDINDQSHSNTQKYVVYKLSDSGSAYAYENAYYSYSAPDWVMRAFGENIADIDNAGLMDSSDKLNLDDSINSITDSYSVMAIMLTGKKNGGASGITTLRRATQETAGVMSAADKQRLDESMTGMSVYPEKSNVRVDVDRNGVRQSVTIPTATQTTAGVLTAEDKQRLDESMSAVVTNGTLVLSDVRYVESTLYSKGETSWTAQDVAQWQYAGITGGTIDGGLYITGTNVAYSATKFLTVKGGKVRLTASLTGGSPTGRNGSYDYLTIGHVSLRLYGQEAKAVIAVGDTEYELTGFERGGRYAVDIEIDVTGMVIYEVSGAAKGTGTVFPNIKPDIRNIVVGHHREGAEGYESIIVVHSVTVVETVGQSGGSTATSATVSKINVGGRVYNVEDASARNKEDMTTERVKTKRIDILDPTGKTAGHINVTSDYQIQLISSKRTEETANSKGLNMEFYDGIKSGWLRISPEDFDVKAEEVQIHSNTIHHESYSYGVTAFKDITFKSVGGEQFEAGKFRIQNADLAWQYDSSVTHANTYLKLSYVDGDWDSCFEKYDIAIKKSGAFHIRYVGDEPSEQTSGWSKYRLLIDRDYATLKTSSNTQLSVDEDKRRVNFVGGDFRYVFKEVSEEGEYVVDGKDKVVLLSDVVKNMEKAVKDIRYSSTSSSFALQVTTDEKTSYVQLPMASTTLPGIMSAEDKRKLEQVNTGGVIDLTQQYIGLQGGGSVDGDYSNEDIINAQKVVLYINPSDNYLPDKSAKIDNIGRYDLRVEGGVSGLNGSVCLSFDCMCNYVRYNVMLLWDNTTGRWGIHDSFVTKIS